MTKKHLLTFLLLLALLLSTLIGCVPAADISAKDEVQPDIPNLENKYFLSQLSGSELEFCTTIYGGLMALTETIDVSRTKDISFDRADELIQALFNDCPELYMCTGEYTLRGVDSVSSLDFRYRMSRDEYYSAAAEISTLIAEQTKYAAELSDYDKALFVHDLVNDGCSYSVDYELGDTAYGAIVGGKALCQGYAKAFQLIMHNLGIRCLFVSSAEMVHGWNIVELDGDFYQLDLTWNDSGDKGVYAYFNMSDELAATLDHSYDRLPGWSYPECSSTEHNYYVKNGIFVAADNDIHSAFTAQLNAVYAAGGGRLSLMAETSGQLNELLNNQHNWISEWNEDKYLTVGYTRLQLENNEHVYIAEFTFE